MKLSQSLAALVVLVSIQGCGGGGGGGGGGGEHSPHASPLQNRPFTPSQEPTSTINQGQSNDAASMTIDGIPESYWKLNGMTFFQKKDDFSEGYFAHNRITPTFSWISADESLNNNKKFSQSQILFSYGSNITWNEIEEGGKKTIPLTGYIHIDLKNRENGIWASYSAWSEKSEITEYNHKKTLNHRKGIYKISTSGKVIAHLRDDPKKKNQGFPEKLELEVKDLFKPYCVSRYMTDPEHPYTNDIQNFTNCLGDAKYM